MSYDWAAEKRELRDKTVEPQRAILAAWISEVVWQMGCTCRKAERFFAVPLNSVLKP
jgi:hypothetical protein